MKTIELLEITTEYAKDYKKYAIISLECNRHMNEIEEGEKVQQRHIDAILVDFINFIAMKNGVDYAMYTKDLKYLINQNQ